MNDLLKPTETVEFDEEKYLINLKENVFADLDEIQDGIGEEVTEPFEVEYE